VKTPHGLFLKLGDQWSIAGNTAVRGHATVHGRTVEGRSLAESFEAEPLERSIAEANGGFAAVQVGANCVVAGVDTVRSIPLFYAQGEEGFYLSDDAEWIASQLPPVPFDPIAKAELLAVGYVTGSDTLHPRIKQVLAGQLITVAPSRGSISTDRYFIYKHGSYFEDLPDALLRTWDETLRRITQRLVESVAGRPIVVPLSGGLDSRLLLLELRRIGYENVRTFTYGVPGNSEATIAQDVAAQLGYPWIPVHYSLDKWRRWYASDEFAAYRRYAEGLATVAHVQDWPAVWELHDTGELPSDAVFVPGHNGGFLFGENGNMHRIDHPTLDDLVRNLERVHYTNVRIQDRTLRAALRRRLIDSFHGVDLRRHGAATSAWEAWEWQERQAKFMCNAVRVYEFWGYDWRLPLWDREAIDFWLRVPINQRARARLHRAYVERASRREGLRIADGGRRRAIRSALMRDYVPERLKNVARRSRTLWVDSIYANHPMAWYGIIDRDQFRKLYTGTETINSILALDRLDMLPSSGDER
jgi:asparagine synthase (glutamine-hydrolysing)